MVPSGLGVLHKVGYLCRASLAHGRCQNCPLVLFAPAEQPRCTMLTQEVQNLTHKIYLNAAQEVCFLLQLMQKIIPNRVQKVSF